MAFNIQEFVSITGKKAFGNPSHFQVQVTSGSSSGGDQEITFRADQISFPAQHILTADYITYGPIQKVGYAASYPEIQMSVMLSEGFDERIFFEEWQDKCINKGKGQGGQGWDVGYYDSYKGTLDITQFSVTGEETYKCKLEEAYPITVGEVTGDWAQDGLSKINITWAYRYYTDEKVNAPGSTSEERLAIPSRSLLASRTLSTPGALTQGGSGAPKGKEKKTSGEKDYPPPDGSGPNQGRRTYYA